MILTGFNRVNSWLLDAMTAVSLRIVSADEAKQDRLNRPLGGDFAARLHGHQGQKEVAEHTLPCFGISRYPNLARMPSLTAPGRVTVFRWTLRRFLSDSDSRFANADASNPLGSRIRMYCTASLWLQRPQRLAAESELFANLGRRFCSCTGSSGRGILGSH